jgi:3-deoxy-D-manno-octulosonate 8-phosphate phosphatase (KDO 8-P phosphatase)
MNTLQAFKSVKAFVFDIDGVLASDTLLILEGGALTRNMNSKDGHALRMAVRKEYPVAVISGSDSEAVKIRLSKLGVKDIFLQVVDKKQKLQEYISQTGLDPTTVLYMGDDIPDYSSLKMVGMPCCPANAAIEIKQIVKYISPLDGGNGCVRDVIEKVLKLNGHWDLE